MTDMLTIDINKVKAKNLTAEGMYGKEYVQSNSEGNTSIIDTDIFSGNLVGIYFICGYGNPDSSNIYYRDTFSGYIHIGTGTNGIQTQTYITYQEIFKSDRSLYQSSGELDIEILFWDGSIETDNCIYSSTTHKIRVKISGYVGIVGFEQKIFITKIG